MKFEYLALKFFTYSMEKFHFGEIFPGKILPGEFFPTGIFCLCRSFHSPLLVLQYLPPPLLNLLLVVVDDDPPAGDNLHIETGYERLASVVRRRRRLLLNLGPN